MQDASCMRVGAMKTKSNTRHACSAAHKISKNIRVIRKPITKGISVHNFVHFLLMEIERTVWLLVFITTLVSCDKDFRHQLRRQQILNQISLPEENDKTMLCSTNNVAYTVNINQKLIDLKNYIVNSVTEKQCLAICSHEKNRDGTKLPCSSATYNSRLQQCIIHSTVATPTKHGILTFDDDSVYYEKFCLNDIAATKCPVKLFYRLENRKLPNAAKEIKKVQNLNECLNICAASDDSCKSAMFLIDDKSCILNDRAAGEQSQSMSANADGNIIYFDNGCAIKNHKKARLLHERVYATKYMENLIKESLVSEKLKYKNENQALPAIRSFNREANFEDEKLQLGSKSETSLESKKIQKNQHNLLLSNRRGPSAKGSFFTSGSQPTLHKQTLTQITAPEAHSSFGSRTNVKFLGDSGIPTANVASFGGSLSPLHPENPQHMVQFNNFSPSSSSPQFPLLHELKKDKESNGPIFSLDIQGGTTPKPTDVAEENLKKTTEQLYRFQGSTFLQQVPEKSNIDPSSLAKQLSTTTAELPETTEVGSPWSAWNLCSLFHTEQPCLGEQRLGFQSRRCLATNQFCKGPLIRYCAMPC
ncbi:Uncharacterized protein T4A_10800 [Trichinella pseudospiralis]|uniref:Apple domain-containing protein n=1 Tax=Trichinella pseudospiralis TaxID=6337 RepID=A0A0V1ECJ0_TRIPS|nr:Uncharacterized protein T4E_9919 [Trichinella pseudospiralis]KRY71527.1 Uncharacterized protein T4A_10800 [Trichinella pseudospiralis]